MARLLRSCSLLWATLFSLLTTACREGGIPAADLLLVREKQEVVKAPDLQLIADTVTVFTCPANAACAVPDNAFLSMRLVRGSAAGRVRLRLFAGSPGFPTPATRSDSAGIQLGSALYKVILRDGRFAVNWGNEASKPHTVVVQVTRL